jgi:hypothetical protein
MLLVTWYALTPSNGAFLKEQSHEKVFEIMTWDVSFGQN